MHLRFTLFGSLVYLEKEGNHNLYFRLLPTLLLEYSGYIFFLTRLLSLLVVKLLGYYCYHICFIKIPFPWKFKVAIFFSKSRNHTLRV